MDMDYTWDETKRAVNLQKHHLDFLDADLVYEAPQKLTVPATRANDLEPRWADFAEVHGVVLKLVYTLREGTVRCISLRVASRKERRLYNEARQHRPAHE
jgi:uncharacterized DUF497 family protein